MPLEPRRQLMRIVTVESLDGFQERLGHRFTDVSLLERALTHSSAKAETRPSNERLEFLGDSILGCVVSAFLFREYPELEEGRMTKVKAEAVSTTSLKTVAEAWGLSDVMIVGRMFRSPEDIRTSILANAVEAVIAAVYLDVGFDRTRSFVLEHFCDAVRGAAESPGSQDYKSLLGQWAQKTYTTNPVYRVESVSGPDHDRRFEVVVAVNGESLATAVGRSKKVAEQEAARLALDEVDDG